MILPASDLAIGHCIILNDVEQPCGRLIAIITDICDSKAFCKYLNADKQFNCYNKKNGIEFELSSLFHNPTPVGKFGVDVIFNPESCEYYCLKNRDTIATYRDGSRREWQEYYQTFYLARTELIDLIKDVI